MAPTTAPKKYMSMEQKKYMVDFMAEDLDFANNRFQSQRGKELQKEKWSNLSNALNAIGGATKSPEQWELSWRDLKQKTKAKWLSIRNRQSGENGFLKKKRDVLSELEKMILAIMKKDTIDGDGETHEGGFDEEIIPVPFEADIELLDEEIGNIHPSSIELPFGQAQISISSVAAECNYEDSTLVPPVIHETAKRSRTRHVGRSQRYSETGIQKMESQIFGCLEKMQADNKEYKKQKLELHEKILKIEEKKLVIKEQKLDALNLINANLQILLNRS